MATQTVPSHLLREQQATADWTRYLVPLGRALFALIFLQTAPGHFSGAAIGYAAQQGVPLPELLVPLAGLLALAGGLSVTLGYHARVGALLLVLFLVPVTLFMHQFWDVASAEQAQMQQMMFFKNLSMLGGSLLLAYFGAGPVSLDARREQQALAEQRRAALRASRPPRR